MITIPSVLVLFEMSGVVRDCFRALGVNAVSCDLQDCIRGPDNHVKKDAIDMAYSQKWDAIISFSPCTHLTVANNRNWWGEGTREGLRLFMLVASVPCRRIAMENPVGLLNSVYRPPEQIIHPCHFGHRVQKRTCLWLKNLPPLVPTRDVSADLVKLGRRKHYTDRFGGGSSVKRSLTFPGVAEAMARQWSPLLYES